MWLLHNLTSSGLLSWRGAVRDDGELGLQVHVVVADVPCGESCNKIIRCCNMRLGQELAVSWTII